MNTIHQIALYSFFLVLPFLSLNSTPDLAQWTGNKCSKCHVNTSGGGIRNDFGWKFIRDASIFPIGNEKIKRFYTLIDKDGYFSDLKLESYNAGNIIFHHSFFYGMDFRIQSFRSHKSESAVRRLIPMEFNAYFGFMPLQWLILNTQYNLGKIVFQGQDNWMASVTFQPYEFIPTLKIGKFQPSFGNRDCDMTQFDRRIANLDGTSTLFPPDYSEFGIELSYLKNEMFDISLGAFDSRFLSQVTIFGNVPIVIKHNPTFTGKIVVYDIFPIPLDLVFISYYYLGFSLLKNGKFSYLSNFIGISILDNFLIYTEYLTSELINLRVTRNFINKFAYIITRGISAYGRFEVGKSKLYTTPETIWEITNKQALIGIKLFPIPYLEINAEYRFLETPENKSLRWAFQIHLYY